MKNKNKLTRTLHIDIYIYETRKIKHLAIDTVDQICTCAFKKTA